VGRLAKRTVSVTLSLEKNKKGFGDVPQQANIVSGLPLAVLAGKKNHIKTDMTICHIRFYIMALVWYYINQLI
jgi:hypothetical protein